MTITHAQRTAIIKGLRAAEVIINMPIKPIDRCVIVSEIQRLLEESDDTTSTPLGR